MKLDVAKVPLNISHYGSTGVASIPLLLTTTMAPCIAVEPKLRVGMFGFGVGYSWSSSVTAFNCNVYLEHCHGS